MMRGAIAVGYLVVSLLGVSVASGQSTAATAFEVAAMRASAPRETRDEFPNLNGVRSGGPGTSDPGRITFARVPLDQILAEAFDVPRDLIRGPDFIVTQRYDIAANVPAGATTEQTTLMLQNLLRERLHLTAHFETKIVEGFDLSVAPGGAKLTQTVANPYSQSPLLPPTFRIAKDDTGFPELPSGARQSSQYSQESSHVYARFSDTSMAEFVSFLGPRLGTQFLGGMAVGKIWLDPAVIADKTGLTGRYDFTFDYKGFWVAMIDPSGITSSIKAALEKQLGLRLTESKVSVSTLVIDHINQTPTEN